MQKNFKEISYKFLGVSTNSQKGSNKRNGVEKSTSPIAIQLAKIGPA